MKVKTLTVGMVGAGGDGVVASGEMVLGAVAQEGLFALSSKSFGPQIRGGECSMRVRISAEEPVEHTGSGLDYLIVLNWKDYHSFAGELNMKPTGVIICEKDPKIAQASIPEGLKAADIIEVEIQKLAEEAGAKRAKNVLTLGIFSGIAGLSSERFHKSITKRFKAKGEEVLKMNYDAFEAGLGMAKSIRKDEWPELEYEVAAPKMLVDGNFAIGAAAIAAGVDVFAGYPITPSTEVMQWLTIHLPKFGGRILQCEDEIAAMGVVAGASFAGARAMTTTSGPGMSLKGEIIGMCSIAELPCVIVNVQRGGPSTGIPTKGEQGDLYQALFSAHGDAPRPIVAPYDVVTAVEMVFEAFKIAETYQTPVILLSDGFLAQGKQVCELPELSNKEKFPVVYRKVPTEKELEEGYVRFKITDDLISPMAPVGTKGGNYLASGITHDEAGKPVSGAKMHHKMQEKRIKKLEPLRERGDLVHIMGDEDAELAVMSWGYSVGPVKAAVEKLRAEGNKIRFIYPLLLAPLPVKRFDEVLSGVKKLAVVENNYTGQLANYLRMELELPETVKVTRAGGAVWQPEEVIMRLKETLLS